jgi:hypothetical protein
MKTKLHTVIYTVGEKRTVDLFSVKSFNEWQKKATAIANDDSLHEPDYDRDDLIGDLFELFCQFILTKMNGNFGINDYQPNQPSCELYREDYGTDGFGINKHGEKVLVQCKFRGNPTYTLSQSKDHVFNMILESWTDEEYQPDNNVPGDIRHFVITSCKGINSKLMEKYGHNKVSCIDGKQIRDKVHENMWFWNQCQSEIHEEFAAITKVE